MRVQVRKMRASGRLLRASEVKASPAFVGDLAVAEHRNIELGRSLLRARLKAVSEGTELDVLPELSDVQLLWAGDGRMRLSGFETVSGIDLAQTWSIEVTPC